MNPVCVGPTFIKQKSRELNISEAAIERIAHKYIKQVGDANALPSDDYILDEYTPKNLVSRDQVNDLLDIWNAMYSSPMKAKDLATANVMAKMARQSFSPDAVVIKPLNDGTFEVIVGKPQVATLENGGITAKPKKALKWDDYNDEQKAAITKVADHINAVRAGRTSQPFITIQGKAGTGKTTIVNEILNRMQKYSFARPVVIMGALSHKATTVLKDKISEEIAKDFNIQNKTIAGMLGMVKQDDGSFAPIKGKQPPIQYASVVFIDEASMVNEEQLELIIAATKGRRIPIVFLGDVGQLPPIRMSKYYKNSKISQDAISPVFTDTSIPNARLVTRVRQGESSPVLDYADKYWEFSQEQRQEYPTDLDEHSVVTDEGALIIQRNEVDLVQQLIPLFQEAKRTGNPNLVKIVPYTNNSRDAKESAVDKYNRLIREALYPGVKKEGFFEGDLVIFNAMFGDEESSIPNSFEGAITAIGEITEDTFDAPVDLVPVKRQMLTIKGTDGVTVEVPALVPTKANLKAHQKNIKALREYRNQVYKEGGNYGAAKMLYENYSNAFAANIGYAYAIDSHKSQGSTYDVVAVDVADINSVQPTSLKTKAQSTYTGLTRASNVTIVSSNTTNEGTIYTDIKGINDRINSVKAGESTGEEFIPETEEGTFSDVTEDDIPNLIKDPNRKSKRVKGKNLESVEIDEGKESADTTVDDDDEVLDWDDDESFEEKEETPIKTKKEVKVNKQQQTYRDFVAKQKALNSIVDFNEKDHTYKISGKKADYSVTQFRDFIYDIAHDSDSEFLKISSRLGTTHDSILRDYFADEVKSSYPNMTKAQVKEFVKQAAKLERLLKRQFGDDAIFITDENLLRIAAKVNFDGKDYTVAGTMDMVVIDKEGNIHIVDFKTKRANLGEDLDDESKQDYAFQVTMYKAMLGSSEVFSDKLGKTQIAQFNLRYADPRKNEYSFEGQQVYIEVGDETVKLQEAVRENRRAYTPGVLHSIIGLTTDLEDLTVKPITTPLQSMETAKEENKKTDTEPKQFKGQMNSFYGKSKRSDVKASSTFGAILEGKRTATTRYSDDGHINYWKNAKVGDIITFTNTEGKEVKVRVTVPLHRLSKDTDAKEWSEKEGWSEEYFKEKVLPRINQAWQMEYELVNTSSRPINVTSRNPKYALLSNFGDKKVTVDGKTFKSVEHYFQWCKAISVKDYAMAGKIKNAVSAAQAQYLGRHQLSMTKAQQAAWDKKSENIMRKGMRLAFEQNEDAKQLLLSTGSAELTHILKKGGENVGPFADILMELREEFGGKGKPITEESVKKEFEAKAEERKQEEVESKKQSEKISNEEYNREEASKNTRTLYIFTDNTDRDSGKGIIPANSWYSKKYGEGHHFPTITTAILRGLDNARPISTQRWYHEGAKGETGRWTDADIDEFTKVIDAEFDDIMEAWKSGDYDNIVFPKNGLFNGKISAITESRTPKLKAYLQEKLDQLNALVKGEKYLTPEERAAKEKEEQEKLQEKLTQVKQAQQKAQETENLPKFEDDYFGIQQVGEKDDTFTGQYQITLNELSEDDPNVIDITNGSKDRELFSITTSLPYSSVVSLNEDHVNANFLYALSSMLNNPTLHPRWGERVISIDPNSAEGMYAKEYARISAKRGNRAFQYNSKTGELRIPMFTVGYSYDKIAKRAQSNALFNNGLLSQEELRSLSKAAMYKLSEFITMLQSYPSAYEKLFKTDDASWENDANKDKDFTQMTRPQIIKEIGLTNLLLKVRERVFDSELRTGLSRKNKTKEKLDIIYNNWQSFIELGYDALIGLEEIALDTRGHQQEDIKNELNDVFENEDEATIQEIFGSSIEHWQVGFRQVSAFNSLSQMIKRTMDSLYQLDENGEQILDEYGIAKHLSAQEAVSKILYYTQGATSLDAKDETTQELKANSMLAMLKSRVVEEPWLQQVIDLLEDKYNEEDNLVSKANEQFKTQFYTNFKKYFQKYAITVKDKKGNVRIKVINESQYADTLLKECQAKETSFATGSFKLKTKEGKINQENLEKLKKVYKTISLLKEAIDDKGKIDELVDLDQYHKAIKEALDLLDISTPADESLFRIFGVKKNFKTLEQKLMYLLEGIKEEKPITDMREYQQIVEIVAKEMGLEMESVSYEAGKMYYSYVLPSYLGNLVGKLKSDNMSNEEYQQFLQDEYYKYRWFKKDGKVRNYWLSELAKSKKNREAFQHITSLHYLGTEYSDKTPVEYIASMMRAYFYDDNKEWAYFRVPMMSNKPSEEYIKFKRICEKTVGMSAQDFITDKMWDVFTQELDRIQAVRERQAAISKEQQITSKGKKVTFDKNGFQFCFEDYLHQKAVQDEKTGEWKFVTDIDKNDKQYADAVRFSELLNKKLSKEGLNEESTDYADMMSLFDKFTRRGFEERYQEARQQWVDEGFITLDEEGKIKEVFGKMKLSEDDLREFFWNDAFASTQILELTITDTAYYVDTEDLQKRLAQLHAPGMRANINATYNGRLFTKDGIERTIYIKDDIVKSSALANLKQAFDQIIVDAPKDQQAKLKAQLLGKDGILDAFKKVNFADAQGYNCPSSFRKKMGVFGNWDDKMEAAYEKIVHPEKYPDVNLSDMLDVMLNWQPQKPFVFSNISKPGYNGLLPDLRVGVQNKNSEYTLVLADALLRRAGIPNKLSAIYKFMEESQHDENGELNGEGIDTVQFMSAVNAGCTGVIDLNDTKDKDGNVTHYKTEEEIIQELGKVYDDNGYSPDYVHEIPFEDYMIQQNVPAHFRGHSQAHGSQDRVLTFSDMLDVDPVTGDTNYLIIDGKKISVADAKKQYFQAVADNIEDSKQQLISRFNLNAADPRATNVAISEVLKDTILKDSRFGSDLLWACDTNEYGEFNIPLSDPIQSNRIQQLLNSIIKNNINKQEIAGGPVVQVSNWGTSDQLAIRFKNSDGELLLTEREWNTQEFPKDFDKEVDGKRKWQTTEGYVSYEDYIGDQAGVAYFECFVPIQDADIAKDFTRKDAEGNEYIDIEAMEEANPDLLNMIGYRIPTESKYSMVPIKVKGFLTAGEGVMMPAEITTLAGSDFDIDKLYMMRYTYNRVERDGKVFYEKPTSGRGYRDNLIISTQLAVLQSEQVQKQLFTPGNFDEPKKYGYLISYVQSEAKRTGRDPQEIYEEAKEWDADTLKDLNKTSKNLIFNNVQVQFHKQNMTAGKLIGIFAQANVSHAFISLERGTTLNIPAENEFTLDGINVAGSFEIDDILTRDREINISNNLAALLAASVDAVKDPILNLININTDTANMVTSLLRMGFNIETISLLCSQPIIRDLIKEYGIKSADGYVNIQELINEAIDKMPADVKAIEDISVTTEDLIANLNGDSIVTSYMALQIFNRMGEISDTFGDITHMTRYNSITSAVGPFASDTMLLKTKVAAFQSNKMISDNIRLACGALAYEDPVTGEVKYRGNPMLAAFRESAFAVEKKLLGEHLIQASDAFKIALDTLGRRLGFSRGVPSKIANAFSDFYMSFYVNASEEGSVFDLSLENRRYSLTEFPKAFLKLKEKYNNNILVNSIQYVESDREQYPFLQLKTRGMSSTTLEDLKQAWISLYEDEESRPLAMRLAEYNFFRGSFGFSPKTFMNLTPNVIKSNFNNYMRTLNNRDSMLTVGNQEMMDRVINQFILHEPKLIVDKYYDIEKYEPTESKHPAYGDVIMLEKKPEGEEGKKAPKPISTSRPFIKVGDNTYFVVEDSRDTITLKKVDALGGDHQGFEISITEDFPSSIYDQTKRGTKQSKEDKESGSFAKNQDKEALGILLETLFQDDQELEGILDLGGKEVIDRMNVALEDRGIDYQISKTNKTKRAMAQLLLKVEGISNPREVLNKAQKTLDEELTDLCG